MNQQEYNRKMDIMKIPVRYRNCTFDNFIADKNQQKYVDHCRNFADNPADFLMLFGRAGSGKTHLAVAIMLHIWQKEPRNLGINFIAAPRLFMMLRDSFNNRGKKSELEIIDKFIKCKYLILDDLSKENPKDYVRSTLFEIINERYSNGRVTVCTSNDTLDEMVDRLKDDSIVSRLCENALHFKSTYFSDYRLNKNGF